MANLQFLQTYQIPNDVEESRRELVQFLRGFESLRNNSIIDYAPRYEQFLKSIGY